MRRDTTRRQKTIAALAASAVSFGIVGLAFLTPSRSYAIPAFARKYGTSCTTCHLDFPLLNDFGKAFKDAGFKFPTDDASMLKQPPVMLGAEAQKMAFPNAVWPGEIPGNVPVGLRMNNFFQVTSSNRNKFNALTPPGSTPQFVPGTDFETGLFSLFTAGNFGGDIAYWVDDDISVGGDNAAGGLGDGYFRFVDLSRLMKMPKDSVYVRIGQFELDLPYTQARTINISPYDIYNESNIGAMTPFAAQQNVVNQVNMATPARGVEVSGGHLYGGYHYSVAVFDQSSNGVAQSANMNPYVPSATGAASDGVGFASDTTTKDIFARFSYRFNLERDPAVRHEIQAAGSTGPRDHTYLTLGGFYMHGDSNMPLALPMQQVSPTYLNATAPFYRVGGNISFNYRNFYIYGLYMFARDDNPLPVTSNGALVPLPLAADSLTPTGFIYGMPVDFDGGFVEANYLVKPWIMLIGRWDSVNSTADRINGLALSTDSPFFAPYASTRNRYTPGIQFLLRANIKFSVEYQIRPLESITFVTNPQTGLIKATNPFRVNTLVMATEFVF